jgi:hypothetical protein
MCFADGTKQIPAHAAGYFSKNNWYDSNQMIDGQEHLVKKSSNYIRLIDKFPAKKWSRIIKGAEKLVKGPRLVAIKNYDPIVAYSSDFDIIDGDYGTDDDEA